MADDTSTETEMVEDNNTEPDDPTKDDTPDAPEDTPKASDDVAKWKKMSRQNEKKAKQLESELEKIRSKNQTEQERLIEEARKQERESVMTEVQRERLEAKVIRHASKKLTDPEDAVRLLDVDDLLEADDDDIAAAIEDLAQRKPYLASGESTTPPPGDVDQGARRNTKAFTREQLKKMTPEQYQKNQSAIFEQMEKGLIK